MATTQRPTLFETQDDAILTRVSPDTLHPHPDNPRLEFDEEVVEKIATQLEAQGRFPEEHALLVRPSPDGTGYQIVSGHHRWQAAEAAGLESVPVWVREMTDQEAFIKLVTENDQSELSRLERGMHALEATERYDRNGQSLKSYAERVGVDKQSITQWRNAARVAKRFTRVNLSGQSVRALNEISKAPERLWGPLAEALVEKGWSVRETRDKRQKVEKFEIPERWQGVFLDPQEVITEFLCSTEGFSPQTVSRLADQADKTVSLIRSHDVDEDRWVQKYKQWLSRNAGPNGRQERPYRKNAWRRRGLKNKHKELKAELEQAEEERMWDWHLGPFQDYVSGLEDGSVRLLLADPPYGMGYHSNHNAKEKGEIPGDDMGALPLLGDALTKMSPKLQEDAHVLIFTHWRKECAVRDLIAEHFEIRGSLVWKKQEHGLGDLDGSFSPSHERIIHAVKGDPSLAHREKDVIEAEKVKTEKHPTVKPQDLLRPLIRATTVEGELVADPFAGIGSTVKAAIKEGRRGWGAELKEDYHSIGQPRIEQATQNGSGGGHLRKAA